MVLAPRLAEGLAAGVVAILAAGRAPGVGEGRATGLATDAVVGLASGVAVVPCRETVPGALRGDTSRVCPRGLPWDITQVFPLA